MNFTFPLRTRQKVKEYLEHTGTRELIAYTFTGAMLEARSKYAPSR